MNKVLEWKAAGSKGDCTSVYHLPKTYRGNLVDILSPYFHLNEKGVFKVSQKRDTQLLPRHGGMLTIAGT